MTAALFENWFVNKLIPNIPKGMVIVFDNAPSHSRRSEKIPTTSTRKNDICNKFSV
jgi:hypothetical protein